jgi:hypothetical protein
MRYSPLAFIVALVAAGCAASTGILPAGPDTYTVTERFAPVRGGSTTAQQTALTEANAFCAQQGRQFLPVDMFTPASANPYGTTGYYSVTFRCLLSGDPELTNAVLASVARIGDITRGVLRCAAATGATPLSVADGIVRARIIRRA